MNTYTEQKLALLIDLLDCDMVSVPRANRIDRLIKIVAWGLNCSKAEVLEIAYGTINARS